MTVLATPLRVTAPGGKTDLMFMNAADRVPLGLALRATTARNKVIMRIGGGCANMQPYDKDLMINYFVRAFEGFGGVLFTGATRQFRGEGEDLTLDPMVTDLPGFIRDAYPNSGSVILGTVPRTGRPGLIGDSRFVLDKDGTGVNPSIELVVIVQPNPDTDADWDGDLPLYFGLMEHLKDDAGFTAVGVCAWNGGGVTAKEILASAKRGWPTFVVKGSGRKADEFAQKLEDRDPELLAQLPANHKLIIVSKERPEEFRVQLATHGFLSL